MSDRVFEDKLSRRLKRATAQVAATTPLGLGIARATVGRRSATMKSPARRRLLRSRLVIMATVILGLALASGTTYAGVTLLQAVTQTDPGAAGVYRQNLGEAINLSATVDGVTVTLARAYADVNRVMITYDVKPPPGTKAMFAGFDSPSGQPSAVDSLGQVLREYDGYFETDPRTYESLGTVVYDAEPIAQNVRELSLRVATRGVNLQSRNRSTVAGPFAFEIDVPVSAGQTITVDKTVETQGRSVSLDRVVASPSETRVYLRTSGAFVNLVPNLVTFITGKGYDTRTFVTTSAGELVDLGATFVDPNGELVITFNNTLFGKRGTFIFTVGSIQAAGSISGPWVFHFVVP